MDASRVSAAVVSALLNALLFVALFRMTTVGEVPLRALVPGAVLGGVVWTGFQALGGYLVGHQLRNASEVYGFFATVLGLMSWIFLGARVVLYAAEANVVFARRLWPRSLVQPPLTEADEQALAALAHQQERRPEESVDVRFDRGADGQDSSPVPPPPPLAGHVSTDRGETADPPSPTMH